MTWTRLWKRSLPKAVSFGAVYGAAYCFMVEFQAIQKYFMTTLTEI